MLVFLGTGHYTSALFHFSDEHENSPNELPQQKYHASIGDINDRADIAYRSINKACASTFALRSDLCG